MAQTKKLNKIAVGGNVKISAYKGKRKIKLISVKNNATYNLFNFLLECLAGNLKQNNRPAYLKVLAVKEADFNKTALLLVTYYTATTKLNDVLIRLATGGNEGTNGIATNKFFMLYSAFGGGGNTEPVYPKVFTLCDSNNSGDNELAEVTLATKDDSLEIDPKQMNYSLLIDWSIGFKNPDPVVENPEVTLQ